MPEIEPKKPTYLDLARLAIDGDRMAMESISNWINVRVQKSCSSLPLEIREDIAQDVLMKFYTGFKTFDPTKGRDENPVTNFHRWCNTITRNTYLDRLREQHRLKESDMSFDDNVRTHEINSTERYVEYSRAEPVGISILHRIKPVVTDAQFKAILLRCTYNTEKEVAELVQVPLSTVKGLLRRGLVHIEREILNPAGYYKINTLVPKHLRTDRLTELLENGYFEAIRLYKNSFYYITVETAERIKYESAGVESLFAQGYLPLSKEVDIRDYRYLSTYGDKWGVRSLDFLNYRGLIIHKDALEEFRRFRSEEDQILNIPFYCPEGLLTLSMTTSSKFEYHIIIGAIRRNEIPCVRIKRGSINKIFVNPDEVRAYLDSRAKNI